MEGELANPARISAESYVQADMPIVSDGRPIDLVHLSKQTFGERDLESELLRLFDRQSRQIVDRLTDGPVTESRWRADLAHTLKGSARAVGAFGVAPLLSPPVSAPLPPFPPAPPPTPPWPPSPPLPPLEAPKRM